MRTYIIIILSCCIFFMIQCHHTNNGTPQQNDTVMVDSMSFGSSEMIMGAPAVDVQHAYTLPTCTLNIAQMDSMIKADELPVISKWTKSQYKDEETQMTTEYMTLFDKTSNTVYTVKTLNRRQYVISKRVIK